MTILRRYLEGTLSDKDIETWANLIEAREDICFETRFEKQTKEILYELANPTLTQPLDRKRANVLLEILA